MMPVDIYIKGLDGEERLVIELVRFHISADYDQPDCTCSYCGLNFRKEWELGDVWQDEEDGYEMPIRLFFNEGKDGEARFHPGCFVKVYCSSGKQFQVRDDIVIRWVDDDNSIYQSAGPVCEGSCHHHSCRDLRFLREIEADMYMVCPSCESHVVPRVSFCRFGACLGNEEGCGEERHRCPKCDHPFYLGCGHGW